MSSELTAFVSARLDEDEAGAKLAAREGGTWTQDGVNTGNISSLGGPVVYDEGSPDEYQAAHIARHDPARVLREVEAKRRILTWYYSLDADYDYGTFPDDTIAALALPYSDHLDYRAGWRP